MLLDPDDVSAGHVVRFRRAAPGTVVRSRQPAHPGIVTIEAFTRVQVLRRSKAGNWPNAVSKAERAERRTNRCYLFQGLVRCAMCGRKMECHSSKSYNYYRCVARTLSTSSSLRDSHPATVYLREDTLAATVNQWLRELLAAGALLRNAPIDEFAAALGSADPTALISVYRVLRLELCFDKVRGTLGAAVLPQASVGDPDIADWIRLTLSVTV
jgi:hypothetical protein